VRHAPEVALSPSSACLVAVGPAPADDCVFVRSGNDDRRRRL